MTARDSDTRGEARNTPSHTEGRGRRSSISRRYNADRRKLTHAYVRGELSQAQFDKKLAELNAWKSRSIYPAIARATNGGK